MKARRLPLYLLVAGCVIWVAGCAKPHGMAGSPPPRELSLMLRMIANDNRLTCFEISKKGELFYAGGHDALFGHTHIVGPLTAGQRQQVWKIITDNHLLEAPSAAMFAKGEKVTYQLMIDTGEGRRTLRALDEQVPGLKELQDLLMGYQAAVRYNPHELE
jgi:hypothetical protein